MSLIAGAPSTLSSSASESPGKKSYESESPWSAKAEKQDRTWRPVVDCQKSSYSARYSKWDDDEVWSCQEWNADRSMDDRTGQPVVCPRARAHESQSSFLHEKTHHDRTGNPLCLRKNLMIERGHPLSALKDEQGHSNSSLETTKQNWNCR